MYDVIFISYDEPNADENFEHLQSLVPNVNRVHAVKGILNAHRAAAFMSSTKFFWVVDGDNWVRDDFDFGFKWDKEKHLSNKQEPVGFWQAENSVNGLVYGYGGIKLLPRNSLIAMESEADLLDITSAISPMRYYHNVVGSTTVINKTPLQAWRAGFREAAKLSLAVNQQPEHSSELVNRLNVWTTMGWDQLNGEHCIEGANAACEYVSVMEGILRMPIDVDGVDGPPDTTDFTVTEINDFQLLGDWFNAGGPEI